MPRATKDEHSRLLTPSEAARELGVSRMTVYRLIASGQLRTSKLSGNRKRVTRQSLDEYAPPSVEPLP